MKNIQILLHHCIQQTTPPSPQRIPDKIYKTKEKVSLRIHSVVRKWAVERYHVAGHQIKLVNFEFLLGLSLSVQGDHYRFPHFSWPCRDPLYNTWK